MKIISSIIFNIFFLTLFINVKASDDDDFEHDGIDSYWMKYIDPKLKLNQINIPGTHDSGTLKMKNYFVEAWGQTQSLDILDQLHHGIRYLDLRLAIEKDDKFNDIFISHGDYYCYDPNSSQETKLYLTNILHTCMGFLDTHPSETIIVHLKRENVPGSIKTSYEENEPTSLATILAKNTILDPELTKYFYYNSTRIPTLEEVQGRIVILTRGVFQYDSDASDIIGYNINVPGMGECDEYKNSWFWGSSGSVCYPVVTGNYRFQDNYNLEEDDKWDLLKDMLEKNVQSRTDGEDYIVLPDSVTETFYNVNNSTVLTINFMNMARMKEEWWKFWDTFDSSIEYTADYVNKRLKDYIIEHKDLSIHNEWFIMDFPTTDVIRSIYQTNDMSIKNDIKPTESNFFTNALYYFTNTILPFVKRDGTIESSKSCLQRKIVTDELGKQQDMVKIDYKCTKNKLNKWSIKRSSKDNFYSIVSAYDGKCLNYSDDKLYMEKCKDNNKNEDFSIKDGKICSRLDKNKCLDGIFDVHPVILESKIYDNLTCSTRFAKRGIKCCSNKNTKVEYVDNIGNWGIENGELCGIGYSRCSFSAFGYKCCSSVNPEVVYTDELGNWGEEDGEWCGIDEAVYDTSIRIKNRKTGECLITNLHSDTNVVLTGDCNHSIWTYNNENLVLNATGKCLYAMNSQDPRMTDCDEPDKQINHHIHFKLVNNKYICLKNSVDPEICLNGNNRNGNGLKFETSKDEYSEWYLESWNGKVVGSIEEIVRNNSKLRYGKFVPTTSTTTSTPEPTSEPISECHSKAGYPCCSSDISEIVFTDEEGNWGSENNEWCLMADNSQDIINNTESECPYDGYPCCSSNNTKFYFSDESGIWGYKNTNWGYENGYCIINDDISKYTKVTSYDLCIFDFYGYPCCSSNVTEISMTDDSGTRWGEENGNYCGYYESKSDYKSYWFYHAESNKCLYAPENIFISDKVTLKTCDESDYSKWMTLESRTGFIYSVAYPNYCININSNDEITLGLCNNYAKISHTDSALFIPTLFEDKCIGLLNDDDINKDSISLRLNTCTNKLSDNFYVWNETDYKQNIMNLGKYNYCSSNISEIVFTDDVGNWGVENGEWCLIKDN